MAVQSVHSFSEKVALITDGSNPIGRAIAMQLALLGAYVIVGIPENSDENANALQELKSLGTLANAIESDITIVEGAKFLVDEVEKMFGRLDLLVNTLKFGGESTFLETDDVLWTKTIDGNLKSTFFVTQAAIPLMMARPKPTIVNTGFAQTGDALFEASHAGLIGLTKSLAREFSPKFRINCVSIVKREVEKNDLLDPELFRQKTGIAEDDVARTVVYLLSSEAVGLNGQIITVG
jgi:3-oxoacyl-[acyl-carrier protein] reductase